MCEISIDGTTVRLGLTIEQALDLQADLARCIQHAMKHKLSSTTLVGPIEVNDDKKNYPGLFHLNVTKD